MNQHGARDRYVAGFVLQGSVTVPDALTPAQLRELNALWDEYIARDMSSDKTTMR